MSPAGLGAALAVLAAVTLAIGLGFAAAGAWMVLPFAGIEALALAAAYVAWARRAPGGRDHDNNLGRTETRKDTRW